MTYHPSILRIKVMNVWFNPILICLQLKKNCTTSFTSLCSPVHPKKQGIKSIRFGTFMGTHAEESFPNFIQLRHHSDYVIIYITNRREKLCNSITKGQKTWIDQRKLLKNKSYILSIIYPSTIRIFKIFYNIMSMMENGSNVKVPNVNISLLYPF